MMTREEFYKDIYTNVCIPLAGHYKKIKDLWLKEYDSDRKSETEEKTDILYPYLPFATPADLDRFYDEYVEGKTLEDIYSVVEKIASVFFETAEGAFEIAQVPFDEIKERIICLLYPSKYCGMVNETQVHDDYTYFKALFYVDNKTGTNNTPFVPIMVTHLEAWGKDRDDIFEAAMENQISSEILLVPLEDAWNKNLSELGKYNCYNGESTLDVLNKTEKFLLTSSTLYCSSSLALNDRVLSNLYKLLGTDYYVLLVSFREIMIIPDRAGIDIRQVMDYQKSLYGTKKIPDEAVADEIFYFVGKRGQLIRVHKTSDELKVRLTAAKREIIIQSFQRANA